MVFEFKTPVIKGPTIVTLERYLSRDPGKRRTQRRTIKEVSIHYITVIIV